jgi:hypothetical protein
MGIATGTLQQLLQEHRTRPFLGRLLTLGKQDIFLSDNDVSYWMRYYGLARVSAGAVEYSPKPEFAARGLLSDHELFRRFGVTCESLDASDYEGCDHVADLNSPAPPAQLRGQFDLVLDTGTFEHVFHVPAAFQFCHGLLKDGGRMIHMSPLSNYADHGFYQFSPTLFHDFYEANGWRILQMKVIRHSKAHDTEPHWVTDYSPDHFASVSYGGLDGAMYQSCFVVEKKPGATATRIPQQRAYRVHQWFPPVMVEPEPTDAAIAQRIRDRLQSQAPWIAALRVAYGDFRIAIYGAGKHTTLLLRVWRDLALPEPAVVIQSTVPAATTFDGIPLAGLDDLPAGPLPHLIILSSHTHEREMARTCRARFPSIPTFAIWT